MEPTITFYSHEIWHIEYRVIVYFYLDETKVSSPHTDWQTLEEALAVYRKLKSQWQEVALEKRYIIHQLVEDVEG